MESAPEIPIKDNDFAKYHLQRITTSRKITSSVSQALLHLKDPANEPLLLHTFTPDHYVLTKKRKRDESDPSQAEKEGRKISDLIPRLISVVEIVKRECKTVHQYNQMGCLEWEEDGGEEDEEAKKKKEEKIVLDVVNGRKRPRKNHTPYLKVWLSMKRIDELEGRDDVTYQPPATKKTRQHRTKTKSTGTEGEVEDLPEV